MAFDSEIRQLVLSADSEWLRDSSLDTPIARNDVVTAESALIMHAINAIFSSIYRRVPLFILVLRHK